MKKIFLAGEWVLGQGKPTVSYFPADGTKNDEFSTASVEQVDEAVRKAHQAWQQPE